ncbi:MAG: hypothetical protein ACYDDF_00135 [Thermoplasmatota archaeon]
MVRLARALIKNVGIKITIVIVIMMALPGCLSIVPTAPTPNGSAGMIAPERMNCDVSCVAVGDAGISSFDGRENLQVIRAALTAHGLVVSPVGGADCPGFEFHINRTPDAQIENETCLPPVADSSPFRGHTLLVMRFPHEASYPATDFDNATNEAARQWPRSASSFFETLHAFENATGLRHKRWAYVPMLGIN